MTNFDIEYYVIMNKNMQIRTHGPALLSWNTPCKGSFCVPMQLRSKLLWLVQSMKVMRWRVYKSITVFGINTRHICNSRVQNKCKILS